jgi:hypothetical protein
MPLTVSLGWPIRSLVGAVIGPPLPDGPIATSADTHREVRNLDFEVKNLDFTAGGRLATLQP